MKATRPCFALFTLVASLLLANAAQSQTAFDPARAAESIRPDVSAQPLLQEMPTGPRGLADENNFAIPTPGDSDIGQQLILKRQERYQPFYAALDSSEFYTDNAANVHTGAKGDWLYAGGATLGWQPRLTNRLYLDTSVAQHWFRYGEQSSLDYEDGEATAGVILVMPELWNTLWHLHYYYERITQGLDNKPVYQTHTIRGGAQKTILIDRSNSINLSLLAALSAAASPSELQRHEYSFYAAWNYKVVQDIFFTASYRLGYYDYINFDGRHDWYNNVAAALTWRPRDWVELALSWNYSVNRSTNDIFSYNAQLVGPSLSLKAKF